MPRKLLLLALPATLLSGLVGLVFIEVAERWRSRIVSESLWVQSSAFE